MLIYVLVAPYFCINCFFLGLEYKSFNKKEIGASIIAFILLLFFGCVFYVVIPIIKFISKPILFMFNYFQLSFFWNYLFFKSELKNRTLEDMIFINEEFDKKTKNKGIQYKVYVSIYNYCVVLINKLNNYDSQNKQFYGN